MSIEDAELELRTKLRMELWNCQRNPPYKKEPVEARRVNRIS